jgi:ketosteroid isomerase-like protein
VADNKALIEEFYTAFSRRDGEAMAACYHPEARFSDPVFPDLRGPEVGKMWRMLCERGKDLEIEFRDVQADGDEGRAHWDATYTFSGTGRKVFNQIDATFSFEGGKIKRHVDSFDFWKWTRMALGLPGVLLGWSPIVQNKVRTTAAAGLAAYDG